MNDLISREAAIAAATSCPDSHWGPWIAERLRALPAVQPDAAAIREAALREALKECAEGLAAYVNAEFPISLRDEYPIYEVQYARNMGPVTKALALIDNPGKEVMPSEQDNTNARPDTAPAGLSAGGGADPVPPHGWNVMQVGQIGWHVTPDGSGWKVQRVFGPEVLNVRPTTKGE